MSAKTAADRALLLDTSAALALVLEDHELHEQARSAVKGRRLGLAGHAWFETYSVLTRLGPGRRRSPADAVRLLRHNFPESRHLGADASAALAEQLASSRTAGGAVYDALVGAAAREHGLELLSADARAETTYEALGVKVVVLR
jgi:predicted nucleic acid-binding protein